MEDKTANHCHYQKNPVVPFRSLDDSAVVRGAAEIPQFQQLCERSIDTTLPGDVAAVVSDARQSNQTSLLQSTSVETAISETSTANGAYSTQTKAQRKAYRRSNESQVERDQRLAADAARAALRKSSETVEERKLRLSMSAQSARRRRLAESEHDKAERLARNAERERKRRARTLNDINGQPVAVSTARDEHRPFRKSLRLQELEEHNHLTKSSATAHQNSSNALDLLHSHASGLTNVCPGKSKVELAPSQQSKKYDISPCHGVGVQITNRIDPFGNEVSQQKSPLQSRADEQPSSTTGELCSRNTVEIRRNSNAFQQNPNSGAQLAQLEQTTAVELSQGLYTDEPSTSAAVPHPLLRTENSDFAVPLNSCSEQPSSFDVLRTSTAAQRALTQSRTAAAAATRRRNETREQKLTRLRASAEKARQRRAAARGERLSRFQVAAAVGRANLTSQSSNNENETQAHDQSALPIIQAPLPVGIATTSVEPTENYLGPLCVACDHCGALFFRNEAKPMNGRFNLCCNFGNVSLNLFADFPDIIRSLLSDSSSKSKNFRQHIRSYNSALAMASMGAQVDTPRGSGPYCYRIHGQIYHFVGPIEPEHGTRRQYGQLYILDTDDATAERLGNPANEGCDPLTMRELTVWFHAHNEYAASFRMVGDIVAAEERTARLERRAAPRIRMFFDSSPNLDRRRYNIPATNEVAVVFVGEDNDVPATRSLAIHRKDGKFRPIQDIDGRCDPLTYPLFFPEGGLRWHVDLTKNTSERTRTRITQREFYSYLLHVRKTFNPLHHASKLPQQFAVDAYVKIEQNRLNYTRTHQKELRIDSYQGLMDHLASDDAHERAGQRVILPATFQGGPRAMHQAYQDAMAIVAKYGKPDYFLTFTCNPRWKEISENLYFGQSPSDRPDIVARVFHRKLEVLKENLFKNDILGRVSAYVGVIEWQKRGLPHCHMLLIMAADSKPRDSAQIDAAVQAYLPDQATSPRLFSIVASNMVHRQCGATRPTAPCMVNGACSKNFPKEFREETVVNTDGYPKYKRPNDGRSVHIRDETFDNRHIVPYNRFLLMLLNAHINLEICGYVKAVKYLYKYVYKGPDRASLRLLQNDRNDHTDEIRSHLDALYVCSPEALHHIFMYECQFKSDTVCRLQVHLPNFQTVTFPSGGEKEAVERGSTKDTTLTAWFKINAEYEQLESENSILPGMVDPRTLYYHQLPEHFTFVKSTGKWKKRGRGTRQIGRMYIATPKQTERYSLRILLLHRKNMQSFEDLRSVNGQLHHTFLAAARALGLLHDDIHYEHCLEEAACFQMSAQLRALFCYLLAFCEVNDPSHLFERFKSDMSEDFVHRGATTDYAVALAYYEMSDTLETLQCDLTQRIKPPSQARPEARVEEADYVYHGTKGTQMFNLLNDEQRLAANSILTSCNVDQCILTSFNADQCKLHFVDGPGGSGKTFLYNSIYHILKGQRKSIVCVAWTGIAASLLPEGRTASSMFKFSMQSGNRECMLRRESKDAVPLKNADVIIWDEISMVPKHSLEAVDLLFKDLMCNTIPFGGKTIVLGGDFRQVLPIAEHGTESDMIDMCVKNSILWPEFRTHTLSLNMRTGESDLSWCNFLIKVGNGEAEVDAENCIELPQDIISNGNLIEEVFGNQISNTDILSDRAILAPRNIDVNRINEEALSQLPGEQKKFQSVDEVISDEYCEYSTEFLNSLSPAGLPPHNLRLKKGAIVMLLRSLDVKKGLMELAS